MVNLGIYEGDLAVVKKTTDINDKDIVIANIDGKYTIKIYRIKNDKIWLEATNPDYKNIYPKIKLDIVGKVTGKTRKKK